jgi:sugar-phosphatase
VLFWRGYGAAADSTGSQTLDVVLRPGVAAVPVEVRSPHFDLIDGAVTFEWEDVGVDEDLIVRVSAKALLLDMDGVLVDSTGLVEEHWSQWAERRGLDATIVLRFAHGSPSREVVARFVPAEDVTGEAAWVDGLALHPTTDEVALPGAHAVLTQRVLPVAVVTSATHTVAQLRLTRAGLPVPAVLIGADDVTRGKPDPLPYLRAAQLLNVAVSDCVGIEDTPAGLASIRAAGAKPLALLTTHQADQLSDALALLADLRSLRVLPAGVGWDSERS